MQFLMLRALERGASLADATEVALAWGAAHPGLNLFEHRPYADWPAVHEDEDDEVADTADGSKVLSPALMGRGPTQRSRPRTPASATSGSKGGTRRRHGRSAADRNTGRG
jgi:hypothetical protein